MFSYSVIVRIQHWLLTQIANYGVLKTQIPPVLGFVYECWGLTFSISLYSYIYAITFKKYVWNNILEVKGNL